MDKNSRHDRLKQRLAGILLRSSCTNTTTTSAAAFVTRHAAPAPASCEPRPNAGPRCSHHEPSRPKIDRRRGRSARVPVCIDYDCSRRCVGAGTGTVTSSRRSVAPVVVRAEKNRSSRGAGKRNGDHKPRSPSHRHRYSCSSSALTDDDEEEEKSHPGAETTLFSSLSFSSDSTTTTSDFYTSTRRRPKQQQQQQHRRKPFRMAPAVDNDGVVGGGVAVVKRSHNPYADFKRSMVEMVVERRIRGADGMGELLVPYLSLNSPRHHPAILAAFDAVWGAVFVDLPAPVPHRSPSRHHAA